MKNFLIVGALLLAVSVITAKADLLDCEEKIIPSSLSDIPGVGPKLAGESSAEHEVRDFFKSVGCQIKKGASKVSETAKKIGSDISDGAKKLGSDIQSKFNDFKDKISADSSEEQTVKGALANVELINPDILKAEQQCGHGHILDALGNCSKLRK